jgi:hypothetical protein
MGVEPMDCEKIREKFSSFIEGELTPSEDKMIKEHLSACLECQKDFETFKKTMDWLHSVDEVEAPEGFLTEIYQKMKDQKRMETRHGWAQWLRRINLPVQAVAMVAIVFAVLYLTKIIPMETPHSKRVDKPLTSSVPSEERTDETIALKKGNEKRSVEQKKAEPKETSMAELKSPPSEEKRAGRVMLAKESPSPASISAPIQEIVLRTSDPKKSLSELQTMVKQFGGEIVKEEEYVILASLPIGSLSEFKRKLEEKSFSKKAEVAAPQREAPRAFKLSPKTKGEVGGKEKEMGRPEADQAGRMTVRILLLKE